MSKNKEKIIIIDGNALIHRSFHALPPTMTTKDGEPTNAVYGFTTVVLKAIKDFNPDFIALTLDRKEKTFRHEEYKEYKATRVKAPDELYSQIPRVKEIASAFNIPIFELPGFEADDLIGTIAKKVDKKIEKIIVTGDMDTLQLVNDHTFVYTMSRGLSDNVTYDEKAVTKRYGLKPDQMIDYKALRGDPSDNIPGVKGIGEKTATELLREFKTLDGVYKNLNSSKIKERIKELLKEHKDDALMSRRLATINTNAPIDFDLAKAKFGHFDLEKVIKIFSELEFKSLLPRVYALENSKNDTTKENGEIIDKFARNAQVFKYYLVDDDKKFDDFYKKIKKEKEFTFDIESSGADPIQDELLGISFSWREGEAYYINVKSQISNLKNNLFNYKNAEKNIHPWLEKLKPIMEDEKIKKFGHNIKFDTRFLLHAGIVVKGISFDTMIASYLLNPGTRQHNLDAVTFSELGHVKISKEDLLGKGRDKINFNEVDVKKLSIYSCEDADFTNRLVKHLGKKLKTEKLENLFYQIEMPLVMVLAHIEENGTIINKNYLAKIKEKTTKKLKILENKIHKEAGEEFNINSTQQLRNILFNKLAIPTDMVGKIKTGLSTAADELEKLKDLHSIIPLIQEYRELNKLLNTYIDALPELVNPKTHRLHTSFNQAVTATGRLSSTEPNLQNIPVRTELGQEIRCAFVADKGTKLLSLDYSQIELRLAAHMSGDKKMLKAFINKEDIHTATAAEINQVSLDKVTREMRREAKAVNFGILYGQGPHGLSQSAKIPYARAKEFIAKYFESFKETKIYIDATIEKARIDGYVETMFGRRRYLPEINSSMIQLKKQAERMAVNTPIQGTAADMIKTAMIEIEKTIERKYNKDEVKMIMQVHDELLFEVKEKLLEAVAKEIKAIMENMTKLKVPIIVDTKIGNNWGELIKLEVRS